jgi:4-hydroxymandelate oxidase
VDNPVNLDDFEEIARERLDPGMFDYYAGGADDEVTIRANREAFRRCFLKYRVLVDVRSRDLRTSLLGNELSFPVILAPTAIQRGAHPDGERAVARAALEAGVIQTLSTVSSVALEDVAAAAPGAPRWFQLYVYDDRAKSEQLIKRAHAAGYGAIVLTVDLPVLGRRERDMRNAFTFPPGVVAVHLEDIDHATGTPAAVLDQDEGLSWKDVPWLMSLSPLPLVLKGIVRGDDAARGVESGAAAIWVSNHGGRQLDSSIATLDALPEVVEAVAGRVPVILDGGVRRGTDVVKALALGASAVAIGRPQIWGLAAEGADGVRRVLEMLREEVSLAMALCGCRTVAEIDRSLVECGSPGPRWHEAL